MRDLAGCSGLWTGFWIQGPTRGWMRVNLSIRAGRLSGGGSDQSGEFRMYGEYDEATGRVEIDKNYPWLYIEYHGRWDGVMISGAWRFSSPDESPEPDEDDAFPESGVFELWPVDPEIEVKIEGVEEPAQATT